MEHRAAGRYRLQWMSQQGALALDDRIRSLIIRPLCVILHLLRHELILVFILATVALQSRCQPYPDGHPNLIENHLKL